MVLLTCVSLGSVILRTSRGHCGVTPNEADCAAGSKGAWTETSTTGCIQRCLECARCHFVSFSPELQDCSWYNKCSHLEGADGTHETVQVCPSTLPCPGPNPILGRCPQPASPGPSRCNAPRRSARPSEFTCTETYRSAMRVYRRHRAAGESPAEGSALLVHVRDLSVRVPHAQPRASRIRIADRAWHHTGGCCPGSSWCPPLFGASASATTRVSRHLACLRSIAATASTSPAIATDTAPASALSSR